jgi:hypothetical protein
LEFRILGPLELADNGQPVPLGRGKQKALLALLLLHANEVVPAERLIDELWGESPPPTVDNALQNYVSRLRKRVGSERLRTSSPGTCSGSSRASSISPALKVCLPRHAQRTSPRRRRRLSPRRWRCGEGRH